MNEINVGLLPLVQKTKFNKAKSPVKLFEYMAAGKPTVSSKIGEISHIIQDDKNGFVATNKKNFVKKMDFLINNRNLCQRMGDYSKKTVEEKYSLKVLSEKLRKIIFRSI